MSFLKRYCMVRSDPSLLAKSAATTGVEGDSMVEEVQTQIEAQLALLESFLHVIQDLDSVPLLIMVRCEEIGMKLVELHNRTEHVVSGFSQHSAVVGEKSNY